MLASIAKPKFDSNAEWVVVAPLLLNPNRHLKVGEELGNFPRHRLLSFYQRGHIGIKGDPWTERMIEVYHKVNGKEPLERHKKYTKEDFAFSKTKDELVGKNKEGDE